MLYRALYLREHTIVGWTFSASDDRTAVRYVHTIIIPSIRRKIHELIRDVSRKGKRKHISTQKELPL